MIDQILSNGSKGDDERYFLTLYVAGQTPKSLTAFFNLKKICESYLEGRYDVEVVDLLKNPELARRHQIVALPTLVRTLPTPMKKLIGDLSDTEKTLLLMEVRERPL